MTKLLFFLMVVFFGHFLEAKAGITTLTQCDSKGDVDNFGGKYYQCKNDSVITGFALSVTEKWHSAQYCCLGINDHAFHNSECQHTAGVPFGYDFCPEGKLATNVCNTLRNDGQQCSGSNNVNLECCVKRSTERGRYIRPTKNCVWIYGPTDEVLQCPRHQLVVGQYGAKHLEDGVDKVVGIYCCTFFVTLFIEQLSA